MTVVGVYILTVIAFALFVQILGSGQPDPALPGMSALCMMILLYAVPVALAILFGILFPPFLKSFRDILFPILYVGILYSFAVFMWRGFYIEKRFEDLWKVKYGDIHVTDVRHAIVVDDDRTEKVAFTVKYGMDDYPPGEYRLTAVINSPETGLVDKGIGAFNFPVQEGRGLRYTGHFRMTIDNEAYSAANATYDLSLVLARFWPLDQDAKRVLVFSRWAPFFRKTDFTGADPEIKEEATVLETLRPVYYFSLP